MEFAGLHWLIWVGKAVPLLLVAWLLTKTDWNGIGGDLLKEELDERKIKHLKTIVALLILWFVLVFISPIKMADDKKHMRSSFSSNNYETTTEFKPSVSQEYSKAKVEAEKAEAAETFSNHKETK
jgi:hypothetical protein